MEDIKIMSGSGENQVIVDIESLAISMENMMSYNLYMPTKSSIFRIPTILSRHNKKAYIPNAFSIGPFHHGKRNLKPTETIKLKYLKGLITRKKTTLRDLIREITTIEADARDYYAGPVNFSKQEFVKMLVIDGCFIIELMRKGSEEVSKDADDPIFTMSCMLQYLSHDLILLENQIPWIVLDQLFKMTEEPGKTSLPKLTIKFFGNIFSSTPPPESFTHHENRHILDLLRNWLILSSSSQEEKHREWQPIPSVTALVDAGIKFKKGESESILDIKFKNGVLEIPSLLIQETTEVILRNLISFEQCYPLCSPIITSYAKLMDDLITTTKDVDILCKKEIFDNWLNPEDATLFFTKLHHDSYITEFQYLPLCKQLNEYAKRRLPRWRAAYMRNYFGTPWVIASQVAAAILLICALVQTLFTILG